MPRRLAARPTIVLVAIVLAAGCSPAPSTQPASTTSGTAAASGVPVASADPSRPATLADVARSGISVDAIVAGLGRLQSIADANDGTRAAGTPGYDASAAYVADELTAAGFTVERQPVTVTAFAQTAPSVLAIAGGATFEDIHDFKAMTYSASGDVTAPVVALGWNPDAAPGDRSGLGCNPADWATVPRGVIVLVQPAPCRRYDVVMAAQKAGVVALVTSYPEWGRDAVRRPTLVAAEDIHIPVIGGTKAVGVALAAAAAAGSTVHVSTATSVQQVQTDNVIADSPWGDPARIAMLGGHLDSVIDGPGINDNGSGSMTVLEIARATARIASTAPSDARPAWKLRVAFWTGEEEGLFGSAAYANQLTAGDRAAIQAYLNFDMLGSPNGVRIVYQEATPSRPAAEAAIAQLFADALGVEHLAWQPEAIGPASDHYPLQQAGIPIGGLYSGANEVKTPEEAATFGGTPNAPDDACYHLGCDTSANVDASLLGQLARAAAWVTGRLLSGEVALPAS